MYVCRQPATQLNNNSLVLLRRPDASFGEVLDKLVHNRLHRVYVCDADLKPCGVITLTDVLRKLLDS